MIGLNLNLLETNIINLSVVVGVLIYLGGDLLQSILQTRKDTILKSLKDAEERYNQALLDLKEAESGLASAKEEAQEIRDASNSAKLNRFSILLERAQEDKKRFQESQKSTLQMEEDKIVKKLCQECSYQALAEAKKKIKSRVKGRQRKLIANSIYVLASL
jgi:F-type H+-transporting ATPase subunit b